MEDIPTPALPKSPSFGEEFGGFSDFAVPAASSSDPWGSNTKEDDNDVWGNDDWDTSLTRSASSVHSVEEVTEEEEATVDDEEGAWGAPPVGHSLGTSSATKPKGDDDWEEARRRIKIQEERAVSTPLNNGFNANFSSAVAARENGRTQRVMDQSGGKRNGRRGGTRKDDRSGRAPV